VALKDSFRKFMVYVGLTEDDYDEFGRKSADRPFTEGVDTVDEPPPPPRRASGVAVLDAQATTEAPPRRPLVRPQTGTPAVRPITTMAHEEDLTVVAPISYEESKRIGDELKGRRAMVISLALCDAEVGRRILDFSSGVVYTLGGKISRVGPHVYLLVPPNVRVSPESIDRLRAQNFRP
jgi:cell division inhibitor SepF